MPRLVLIVCSKDRSFVGKFVCEQEGVLDYSHCWLQYGYFLCLKYIVQILSSDDRHYLDLSIVHLVENTICSADTSPIPLLYEVDRFEGEWSLGYDVKVLEKRFEILVGLCHAKSIYSVLMNSDQVFFGLITQSVLSH